MMRAGPLLVCALLVTVNAAAQDAWRMAVGGAAIYSTQGTQPPGQLAGGPSIPEPPLGGSAAGFVVSADFPLTNRLSLGAEVSDAARFEGMQRLSHNNVNQQTAIEYRDLLVTIAFRFDQPVFGRLRVGLVAGPSFVAGNALERISTAPPFPSPLIFGPYGPEQSSTTVTIGLTTGIDLAFRVAPHLAVGPTFRAHFISRPDIGATAVGNLRLESTVLRFGGGVRVLF
jgi:hypothetical protein